MIFERSFSVFLALVLFVVQLTMVGCDDSENEFDDVEITALTATESVIDVGQESVLLADFTYSRVEAVGGVNFDIVLRIPSALAYREGSAVIEGVGGIDTSVTPEIFLCPTGEIYLEFLLTRFDLAEVFDPEGDGEARLKLTVRGVSSSSGVIVEGSGSENGVDFECGDTFSEDVERVIEVR